MPEWILAFGTVIGGAVYLRAATALPLLQVGDAVGPRMFPELIGLGLIVSGLLLMLETWRKRAEAGGGAVAVPAAPHATRVLLGMVAWTIVYYVAFEPVGYIVATIVYLFALLSYFHRVAWWKNAACAVGFTVIAYVVFDRLLQVVLPAGILPV